MPKTDVDYANVRRELNLPSKNNPTNSCVVSTALGLLILEIQGELNIPLQIPDDLRGLDADYVSNFARVDEIYEAVRFGKMEFDQKNPSKVILFVGKSQRLLGSVETLREPLAVLRVPSKKDEQMNIVDIVYKKIIFKQRPLPVM